MAHIYALISVFYFPSLPCMAALSFFLADTHPTANVSYLSPELLHQLKGTTNEIYSSLSYSTQTASASTKATATEEQSQSNIPLALSSGSSHPLCSPEIHMLVISDMNWILHEPMQLPNSAECYPAWGWGEEWLGNSHSGLWNQDQHSFVRLDIRKKEKCSLLC